MKKWFYRHRKQIFAVLVVFVMITGTISTVSAVENEVNVYPTPSAPFPQSPTFSDPVLYYKHIPYETPMPLADATLRLRCWYYIDGEAFSYIHQINLSTFETYASNFYAIGSQGSRPLRVSNTASDFTDIIGGHNIYYLSNSIRLSDLPVDNTCDSAIIDLYDFWYIPYTDYENLNNSGDYNLIPNLRDILKIRMQASLAQHPITVSGAFQYMGNFKEYEFNYTLESGSSNISYYDIIRNSPIKRDGHSVPIYIKELHIEFSDKIVDELFESYAWFRIYNPIATVDEVNAQYHNQLSVWSNTSWNYQQWNFDFSWAMQAVNSVLNAPLFGMISLGGIAFVCVGAMVGVALIKILGGAK